MLNDTKARIYLALSGMQHAAGRIDAALYGERGARGENVAQGPFAAALERLGEIANDGEISDLEAARADLLYCFDLMRYLRGAFYECAQAITFAAHWRCADYTDLDGALAILGPYAGLLGSEIVAGGVHPFTSHDGGPWTVWDGTWLGEPSTDVYSVEYAGYELRAVRTRRDQAAARSAKTGEAL